jgi:hypothetical protein
VGRVVGNKNGSRKLPILKHFLPVSVYLESNRVSVKKVLPFYMSTASILVYKKI